ncbi:MAG: hypothetical protein CR984_04685 [Proteobacteria bacterium]|nr:MAG: hypothetical protein CR984_04685 [Pseudomonadota bacterium]PIE67315.1 MAG: hypothetical protein CSA23_04320 [Deltaproteobacteria bacterium]
MNESQRTAAGYHRTTSYRRHELTPHRLDWANQPALDKSYGDRPTVSLIGGPHLTPVDYTDLVMRCPAESAERPSALTHQDLTTILTLAHTVTARQTMASGEPFYFRSVASAGALYPFETYLAAHCINGLDPGLYHYRMFKACLTKLRSGSLPVEPYVAESVAATFYITGIFFRSAWKYRGRAYRYVLLDAGHQLENLRLALRALGLVFSIHLDFDDRRTGTLLGLDPEREVCLISIHLYVDSARHPSPPNVDDGFEPPQWMQRASRVSDRELSYAEIRNVHRAGSMSDMTPASSDAPHALGREPDSWTPLALGHPLAAASYTDVLWQRRSRRNFVPHAVDPDHWTTFMMLISGSMNETSPLPRSCGQSLSVGILAGPGQPVAPGFYLLDAGSHRVGLLHAGVLMEHMAAACLDQMWLKHAGMHLLFMSDLATVDRRWGARGYRYAMIEAGRLGQQAYLAATAVGWGACGIGAFYDREAADLLQLPDDGMLLYLVGVGLIKKR